MGSALRKLATEGKKAGVVLEGQGYGKLTKATIMKLTGYYGKAIRSLPSNLDAMRDIVFTTFFHAALTDEEPHHTYCPEGPDSWFFYQKGLAKGEELGSHREKVGTPLSHEVVSHVKDVYMRMSQK